MNKRVKKLGFIGAGNMATAMVRGLVNSGLYQSNQLIASDKDLEKLRGISKLKKKSKSTLREELSEVSPRQNS